MIFAFAVAVACASCTGNVVYDHYEHTPLAGWDKVDTLTFCVPRLSGAGVCATTLGLRVNGSYPYQGLTLIVEQTVLPADKAAAATTTADTIDCTIFDKQGTVRGQGVSCYQYHYRVSQRQMEAGDSLRVTVRHDMRREIMPGISDVGIKVSMSR